MKAARLFHILAVLTAALLMPGQMAGKVVMNFYEIVTDGTKVSAEFDDGGVVQVSISTGRRGRMVNQ